MLAKHHVAPIFIGGTPRSGTTLLRLLVDSHPQIAITPESGYLFRLVLYAPALYQHFRCQRDILAFIRDVRTIPRMKDWFSCDISTETVAESLKGRVHIGDILEAIYKQYAKKRGKPYWGDKTPKNIQSASKIISVFPNAKFLIIVRDGRDVALSLNKTIFGKASLRKSAQRWAREVRAALSLQSLHPNRVLLIRFEDLIQYPERLCASIFDFIGVDKCPSIRNRYLAHDDDTHHTKSKYYRKPFNVNNRYKWKTVMSEIQAAQFEYIAGAELEAIGYELLGKRAKPPLVRSLWLDGKGFVRRVVQLDFIHSYCSIVKILSGRIAARVLHRR